MPKIRVLIVDDSVVVRRMVGDVISGDADLEVCGTASNGHIAIQKIDQINPDLVTLDIEMPVMDGIETLRVLHKSRPKLPVIMFSTLTERGAAATIDALSLGARDYVTKPANVGSASAALEKIRTQLVPKIRAHVRAIGTLPAADAPTASGKSARIPTPQPKAKSYPQRVDVVAIGTSTGGPNALTEVLSLIPARFPVPIVVVQHMPALFTRFFAERLSSRSQLRVVEAMDMQKPVPGEAYIAPGNFHLMVDREDGRLRLRTNQSHPENSCRPAVDVLFRSVAKTYGSHVLAVIMTGMGQDGLRGCEYIREVGGQILVQDAESSVVWGMPGAVATAGLADAVLPLAEISREIIRRVDLRRHINEAASREVYGTRMSE